jgi:hypothetical protein
MENVCYYTFSTVCQTLAGAFSFLAAIVLYQLQGMMGKLGLYALSKVFTYSWDPHEPLADARDRGDFLLLADRLRTAHPHGGGTEDAKDIQCRVKDEILAMAGDIRRLQRDLKETLATTGWIIAISLGLLAFTPLIAKSDVAAGGSLLVAIGSAGYCLRLYYRLAAGMTGEGAGHAAGREPVASGPAALPYSSGETPASYAIETFEPDTGEWTVRAEGERAWALIEPLDWRGPPTVEVQAVLDQHREIFKLYWTAAQAAEAASQQGEGWRVVRARVRPAGDTSARPS